MYYTPKHIADIANGSGAFLKDAAIMQWIENHQSGKSGIYPYQVALQVCAEFAIPIEEAQDYVAKHIKQVTAKAGITNPPYRME